MANIMDFDNVPINVADLEGVGSNNAMSDSDANRYWEMIERQFGADTNEMRQEVRLKMFLYFFKNSTTTSGPYRAKVVIGGREHTVGEVIGDHALPESDIRRFARARSNIEAMDKLSLRPEVAALLIDRCRTKGINPEYYRAVIDIVEFFPSVKQGEKQEATRISRFRRHKPNTVKAGVERGVPADIAPDEGNATQPAAYHSSYDI